VKPISNQIFNPPCDICEELEELLKRAEAALKDEQLESPVFEEIVDFTLTQSDHSFVHLSTAIVKRARKIFLDQTFGLEAKWSNRLLNSCSALGLKDYPQYKIYSSLCDHLDSKIKKYSCDSRKFLFVGGGPLPLSAIFLAKEKGYQGHVIDSNPDACGLASQLAAKLGINNVSVELSCGCHFGYEHFPVIILAAQAGLDDKVKALIIKQIAQTASPNTLVLLRASSGMRRLLYPEVPKEYLNGFKVLEEESPEKDFISHLVILRKCA
jgi:hypothetical protein